MLCACFHGDDPYNKITAVATDWQAQSGIHLWTCCTDLKKLNRKFALPYSTKFLTDEFVDCLHSHTQPSFWPMILLIVCTPILNQVFDRWVCWLFALPYSTKFLTDEFDDCLHSHTQPSFWPMILLIVCTPILNQVFDRWVCWLFALPYSTKFLTDEFDDCLHSHTQPSFWPIRFRI